jgi:hypothetical protein
MRGRRYSRCPAGALQFHNCTRLGGGATMQIVATLANALKEQFSIPV